MDPPGVILHDTHTRFHAHTTYRDISHYHPGAGDQDNYSTVVRTRQQDPNGKIVTLHQYPNSENSTPDVVLAFGPNYSLGIITIYGVQMEMDRYLSRVRGNSMVRAFRGHDEDVYTWALEPYDGELTWGLRNDRMYSVARYEPCDNLEVSSRDLLYVRDAWMPLTLQIIATLTIMRHIEYYHLL